MLMKKSFFRLIFCFVFLFFIFTVKVGAAPSIDRIGGNDRYETSIKISQNNWEESDYVVLVSGENFPDALSAAPLSKKYNAPILLTQNNSLNENILQEIKRLKANKVFIIGGPGAVSESVENKLKGNGITCTRIYGSDRFETSVKVAEFIGGDNGIFIVSGENFPDAVSAAPIAALKQMPIILTKSSELPEKVKEFIDDNINREFYVVGGEGAIKSSSIDGINKCKRLSGIDRYETNSALINEFINDINIDNVYLANGQGFADALAGSAAAAKAGSPIIIASDYHSTSISIIKSNISNISKISVLGGTGVISDTLVYGILGGGKIKVCLDPGHGGYDAGAVGAAGIKEKDVNLAITLKVGKILQQNNIDVIYTRDSDKVSWPSNVSQDLQKRCDIANSKSVDYFISIHANSSSSSTAKGEETYYNGGSAVGQKLAQSIQKEIVSATGLLDRGVKTAKFYVLRNTDAPAVLVETAFLSNANEEKLLSSDSFQNKIAQAIAKGILNVIR